MKRYILSLSFALSMMICAGGMLSCLGDENSMFALEFANPMKMLRGTWRIKDIYKGSQSILSTVSSFQLPSGRTFRVGDLLAFGQGSNGILGQSGTFNLISGSSKLSLPWKFSRTVVDGQPYTGGISLDNFLFAIKCWTPERWIIYPDGNDDDPWYIELEHDPDATDYEPGTPDTPTHPDTPEPVVNKDGLVKSIVKKFVSYHGQAPDGLVNTTTTYLFDYQAGQQPASFTVNGTTYDYSYSGNQIALLRNGQTVKTATKSGSYVVSETGQSISLTATLQQSSSYIVDYNCTFNGKQGQFFCNRGSNTFISVICPYNDKLNGDWMFNFGSYANNTNVNLNYYLTQLHDDDQALRLPFATFCFYGQKEASLINGGQHSYDLWQNFRVTLNSSNHPTRITYDQVDTDVTTFLTGKYEITITYY